MQRGYLHNFINARYISYELVVYIESHSPLQDTKTDTRPIPNFSTSLSTKSTQRDIPIMAPVRTKKGESDIILLSSPVAGSIRTPERSPIKKSMMISQGQKQALIDNLQLEGTHRYLSLSFSLLTFVVTERARKLRAQYALQAQSLRTRVELRVNRIPTALKKTNLSQLLEKHMEAQKKDQEPKPAMKPATKSTSSKALPKLPTTAEENPTAPIHATRTRGAKRKRLAPLPFYILTIILTTSHQRRPHLHRQRKHRPHSQPQEAHQDHHSNSAIPPSNKPFQRPLS